MIRFVADENFNNNILRGLLLRKPDVDIVRVQDAGLSGIDDPALLEWASREQRVVLTHDVATLTRHAYDRVRASQSMPGVFEVGAGVPIASVIEDLLLIAECSVDAEWEGQVRHLPL